MISSKVSISKLIIVLLLILQIISTNLFAQNRSIYSCDDDCNFLITDSLILDEIVIYGNRIKVKSESGKTTYLINNKLLSATGNTLNLLSHIPTVQVDLKQNISVDGYTNIMIYVDGKERDKSYLSQLNPSHIDQIEVISAPRSNYEGDVSRVLNIIIKKEKSIGVSGHIFSEIPTSKSIVYLFPAYSLNYNNNKINLYTSYNGEINLEDIDEITNRQLFNNSSYTNINSVHKVRQKNLSHKFHFGIDYHLSDRDIINYYGFYNQYSYEQDGDVTVQAEGHLSNVWEAHKEETDLNSNFLNSLYYKHLFGDNGGEIIVDISSSINRSDNTVNFINNIEVGTPFHTNTEKPEQTANSIKIDFSFPINEKLKLSSGLKKKTTDMWDDITDNFSYSENTNSVYGVINYKKQRIDLTIGLRFENSKTEFRNSQNKSLSTLLPYFAVNYKINELSNLNLSLRSSINRPSVYMLNKYTYTDDPFTIRIGNPLLIPEQSNLLQLEHSIRFKSNYISTNLFYETITDAINNLTYIYDSNIFLTQMQNLGSINQYGLQLSGVLTMGMFTFSSSYRFYNQYTYINSLAKQYGVENKSNLVFESGISSILSFKNDFALSLIFQYKTAREYIQDNTYDEALYFISLDKTFKNKLKVGLVSALPFANSFIYQGSQVQSSDFTSHYTGNLRLPTIPLMLRVNYQFNFGINRSNIKREMDSIEIRQKKGL